MRLAPTPGSPGPAVLPAGDTARRGILSEAPSPLRVGPGGTPGCVLLAVAVSPAGATPSCTLMKVGAVSQVRRAYHPRGWCQLRSRGQSRPTRALRRPPVRNPSCPSGTRKPKRAARWPSSGAPCRPKGRQAGHLEAGKAGPTLAPKSSRCWAHGWPPSVSVSVASAPRASTKAAGDPNQQGRAGSKWLRTASWQVVADGQKMEGERPVCVVPAPRASAQTSFPVPFAPFLFRVLISREAARRCPSTHGDQVQSPSPGRPSYPHSLLPCPLRQGELLAGAPAPA